MSYFAFRFFAVKAGIESATPISERVGFRMQSRHFLSCALVAASAWCWSSPGLAQGAAVAPTEVLARGPAGEVTVADVQAMVGVLVPVGQRGQFYANPANIAAMAEAIYGQRALATQARAAKHDETPEARRQLALGANRVLADSWIDHLAGQKAPTDAQLDAHARTTYNANPNQFSQSEQLRARHILVAVKAGRDDAQAKARAEELLAQLRQGRPFDELAREASDDKGSRQRGGDLGTFGKGSMVPEFEAAAFALTKPGQLSEPVKSQFGYHVIELLERIPARRQTFEDVRAKLREDARATLDGRTRKQSWDEAVRDVQVDSDAVQRLVRAPASTKP